jgi:hypothetical protein
MRWRRGTPDAIAVTFEARSANGGAASASLTFQQVSLWQSNIFFSLVDPTTGVALGVLRRVRLNVSKGTLHSLEWDVVNDIGTQWTITTFTREFASTEPSSGRTIANLTVTDDEGDGASATGLLAGGNAFRATYNDASVFGAGTASVGTPISFDSASASFNVAPWQAIPGPVSSMQMQWSFTASANDLVTGSASNGIIPAPRVRSGSGDGVRCGATPAAVTLPRVPSDFR